MDRQYIEIDLPTAVTAHLAPAIDAWIEGGLTVNSRLAVPIIARPSALMHPAVSVSSRDEEIVLRVVDLQGVRKPMYLIEAADAPSKRAIAALEKRLKPEPKLPQVEAYKWDNGYSSFYRS